MPRLRASSPRSGKKEDQRSDAGGTVFFEPDACAVVAVLSGWARARGGNALAAIRATQQAAARSRVFGWLHLRLGGALTRAFYWIAPPVGQRDRTSGRRARRRRYENMTHAV